MTFNDEMPNVLENIKFINIYHLRQIKQKNRLNPEKVVFVIFNGFKSNKVTKIPEPKNKFCIGRCSMCFEWNVSY